MKPPFSIIATVYNKDVESLTTFLVALKQQTIQDFELILVDDCSDVDYLDTVNKHLEHLHITYIRFGVNKGQCIARNVGIRESRGDVVCIVDSDCIANPHFVENHLKAQAKGLWDVVIGPYNIESDGRPIWELLTEYEEDTTKLMTDMQLQMPSNPAYFLNFITRNVSIKREALPPQLFDEDFGYVGSDPQSGFGWEDVEAGFTLFKAGLCFGFEPTAFTIHLSHPSTTDPNIKPLRSLRNFNRLLMKHPQMLYMAAGDWIGETYGRIFEWFVNTSEGITKPYFSDATPRWASIILNLTLRNEKAHPFVIESVLSQRVPGVEIYLVTPKDYKSGVADYYGNVHDYVHVVRTNNPAQMLTGVDKRLTVWIQDNQIMPPKLISDSMGIYPKRVQSFSRHQILRQDAEPKMGGFQSPNAYYYRNLAPFIRGKAPRAPRKELRVLTYRWHCGHQYELYKLPHQFFLAQDETTMDWDYNSRPLHTNVSFVDYDKVNQRDYDLAILHFDENCLNPEIANGVLGKSWGAIFRRFLNEIKDIPRVAICHGTPPFHGMFNVHYTGADLMNEWTVEADRIRDAIGDIPVVCNSWHAWNQWGFKNSRVIWHGFNDREYSVGSHTDGFLYVANSIRHRPWYRGYHEFKYLNERFPIAYLGRDDLKEFEGINVPEPSHPHGTNEYAIAKFESYLETIGRYSVFINTTLRSPMPRSRAEAMLKGLVMVTMDYHDESMYITNGVNGFVGKTKEELEAHLRWLQNNPDKVRQIGMRGRETVRRLFPLSRYHREWQENLVDIMECLP